MEQYGVGLEWMGKGRNKAEWNATHITLIFFIVHDTVFHWYIAKVFAPPWTKPLRPPYLTCGPRGLGGLPPKPRGMEHHVTDLWEQYVSDTWAAPWV